jgi:ABC-type sugar transport system substrate-binding protein
MRHFFVKLCLLLNLFISIAVSAQPLHFALFSPRYSEDAFWEPVEGFAKQAAQQLNIKLSIWHTNNSKREMFKMLKKAKQLNVDAVIFPNVGLVALQMMKEAEQLQLPFLLFNSDLIGDDIQLAGKPQQKYKYWLATLMPDDIQAGYLLGKHLIGQARQKNLTDKNGVVQIIAINGSIADTPAQQRLAGLQRAIEEDGNSNLLRNVYAYWLQQKAYYKAIHLSLRYPDTNVYWAASDLMAIGVEQALTEHALIQGKDYLTGGVDWSKEGLEAVKKGQISASVGGHFMDAAWAVIMLYDHFNGFPLNAETFYQFRSSMSLISAADIDLLLPHLKLNDWKNTNFRLRSKVYHRDLKKYDFSPTSVLKELRKTQ